jgi:hypothetical protein
METPSLEPTRRNAPAHTQPLRLDRRARPGGCRSDPGTARPTERPPRRPRLHRPHVRARHARRVQTTPRPDHRSDRRARAAASRRPVVDPSDSLASDRTGRSGKKSVEIERADARTRTGDPFITSEVLYQLSYVGGESKSRRRRSTRPRLAPGRLGAAGRRAPRASGTR